MNERTSAGTAVTRVLVIGYGNSLRGDDGAGRYVADLVAARGWSGVGSISCDLLTPELADPISSAEKVIFVDATATPQSEIRCEEILPACSARLLGHHGHPTTLLAMAREVFGHAPSAWMLTIPARDFEIGSALSEETRQGIETAMELLRAVCEPRPSATPG